MTFRKKAFITIGFVFVCWVLYAQKKKTSSSSDLEKQRTKLLAQIQQTEKELGDLRQNTAVSVEALKVLQSKLEVRNKLIHTIDREVEVLERGIEQAGGKMQTLHHELKGLRTHYAELVRYSYKNRVSQNLILFLFSAQSFNDMNHRLEYVKHYRSYKADQAEKIENTGLKLKKVVDGLNHKKVVKDKVLLEQKSQNASLERETVQQDKMVQNLQGKEKELMAKIEKKKKTAIQLNNAIASAIKREVEMAQKRAIEEQKRQERLARQEAEREKAALAKKQKEDEAIRLAELKKKQEEENERITLAKRKAEEEARQLALEKKAREEKEKKLALEKKKQEEEEKRLALEKKKREAEEKAAAELAEQKRLKREAELAKQKAEQEEKEKRLVLERKKQEERQRLLALEQERQEKEKVRLELEEMKRRERERKLRQEEEQRREEEERVAKERAENARRGGKYANPRYRPDIVAREEKKEEELFASAGEPERTANTTTYRVDKNELTSQFASRKGAMGWPVAGGYISEYFGKNKHPVFNVYTENYGIDIRTSKGATARAVNTGVVSTVFSMPGAGQTILLSHGDYFTVYSKLASVSVGKGSVVKSGQTIGRVMTDDNGLTTIHFEVWKVGANGTPYKMNPTEWVHN